MVRYARAPINRSIRATLSTARDYVEVETPS